MKIESFCPLCYDFINIVTQCTSLIDYRACAYTENNACPYISFSYLVHRSTSVYLHWPFGWYRPPSAAVSLHLNPDFSSSAVKDLRLGMADPNHSVSAKALTLACVFIRAGPFEIPLPDSRTQASILFGSANEYRNYIVNTRTWSVRAWTAVKSNCVAYFVSIAGQ